MALKMLPTPVLTRDSQEPYALINKPGSILTRIEIKFLMASIIYLINSIKIVLINLRAV